MLSNSIDLQNSPMRSSRLLILTVGVVRGYEGACEGKMSPSCSFQNEVIDLPKHCFQTFLDITIVLIATGRKINMSTKYDLMGDDMSGRMKEKKVRRVPLVCLIGSLAH